jgi:A/G-specific adenine glycosylase
VIEKQLQVWFSKALGTWHRQVNNRNMPWKGISDPYKIWLSEVILQQTRVEQGRAYYERFTERYPRIEDLAQAADNEVFKLWEGLGYYNRCRNLLATAREVASRYNGDFPSTQAGLLALRGVGAYTAAAVGSFAFGLPLAVVDGNVLRVLSRFFAIDDPVDQKAGKTRLELLADHLLDRKDPAAHNQAIMDLGATVCKPRLPQCGICPLQKKCSAYAQGNQDAFPVKSKRTVQKERYFYYLVLESRQMRAVRQRQGKDIWSGLHEYILRETDEPTTTKELQSLSFWGIASSGLRTLTKTLSETITHQLTHQKIHCRFLQVSLPEPILVEPYRWVPVKELNEMAFPRLITRFMETQWS